MPPKLKRPGPRRPKPVRPKKSPVRNLPARVRELPDGPGVYIFRDADGRIIYVGKAASLRKRVQSYFQPGRPLDPKTARLVTEIADLESIPLASEAEALFLESRLVKTCQPRYNIDLKDDKSFPFLRLGEGSFPALALVRGWTRAGGEYYGPFTDVWALRRSLRNLRRVFPVAACRRRIDPARPIRPCLDHSLGRCLAPCAGLVGAAEYDRTVRALRAFFQGRNPELVRELRAAMAEASRQLEFERAARLRDELEALQRVARHPRGLSRKFGRELPAERRVLNLKERLGLEKEPLRIEAYDISNLFGSEAVGSMVTFLAGSPYRDGYRRFRIRGVRGSDDYAMLAEVLRRRFAETGWPKPDLVLVDGGRGQVETARRVMKEAGIDIALVGLAKKFERFFVPGRRLPLAVPPESAEGLFLRQVRDEAHRFAVGYHRRLRSRKLTASWLDGIPGLGPVNRTRLRRAFPSAAAIRAATVEELAAAGIRPELARRVKAAAVDGPA